MNTHNSRKEELDRIFADLSPWDILYLRKKIEVTTITLAGFQDLPPELICTVLLYLDFDDYRCCTRVCRKWRELWAQGIVFRQALRQFFPGLQLTYPDISPQNLYAREVQKHVKWRQPYCSFTWIPWNLGASDNFIDLPEYTQPARHSTHVPWRSHYNKGKLAWQSTQRTFIIDDLHTRQRLRFIPPGSAMTGAEFQAVGMSDKLLVLLEMEPRMRKIHIVHLETREWKQLTLPTALQQVYLESTVVYLVTQTAQIMYFAWGGILKQLDQTKLECPIGATSMVGGQPKVLPHPTKNNVAFVVRAFSNNYGDERLCSFAVTKFEDGKATWDTTESIANPLKNPQPDCHDYSWAAVSFICRRSDNHGTFCIGLYRIQRSETSRVELCSCCEPRTRKGDWGAVTFNVLTQTFRQHEYLSTLFDVLWDADNRDRLVNRNLLKLENVYLWNDDLLLAASNMSDDRKTEIYLQTLHPVGSHQAPSPQWAPVRITCILQAGGIEVFQDDDFVILPTLGGLTIYKPSKTPSDGIIIDDSWELFRGAHVQLLYSLASMSEMLELKHNEMGCGLTTRNERSRGRPESPQLVDIIDQWSPYSIDAEDFEDHYD
ncbi:unnamed protein product [Fusarium graminearum]|nr:hypothetical protein FGRA07_11538 [Fusarium graminearum]CAG1959422.1 unnamed protein product [Fusarium graminearum]CAG2005104.1 unnamed protein product [Fusarium graminearum]VTO84875.1 unnamed protein product [Fusarium graminearum]